MNIRVITNKRVGRKCHYILIKVKFDFRPNLDELMEGRRARKDDSFEEEVEVKSGKVIKFGKCF